jgi:hypothetical protein
MRIESFSISLVLFSLLAPSSWAGRTQYRNVLVPGSGVEAEETCKQAKTELGRQLSIAYEVENVLPSCEKVDLAVLGPDRWAVVFAYDEDDAKKKVCDEFSAERINSPYTYVKTALVEEARTRTRLVWDGSAWELKNVTYTVKKPVYEMLSGEFSNQKECDEAKKNLGGDGASEPRKSFKLSACVETKAGWGLVLVAEVSPSSAP